MLNSTIVQNIFFWNYFDWNVKPLQLTDFQIKLKVVFTTLNGKTCVVYHQWWNMIDLFTSFPRCCFVRILIWSVGFTLAINIFGTIIWTSDVWNVSPFVCRKVYDLNSGFWIFQSTRILRMEFSCNNSFQMTFLLLNCRIFNLSHSKRIGWFLQVCNFSDFISW